MNYINFSGIEPEIVGVGYSDTNNKLRLFMGIPKTYSTYEGVSSIYLIEVIFKIILATILLVYLKKIIKQKGRLKIWIELKQLFVY